MIRIINGDGLVGSLWVNTICASLIPPNVGSNVIVNEVSAPVVSVVPAGAFNIKSVTLVPARAIVYISRFNEPVFFNDIVIGPVAPAETSILPRSRPPPSVAVSPLATITPVVEPSRTSIIGAIPIPVRFSTNGVAVLPTI